MDYGVLLQNIGTMINRDIDQAKADRVAQVREIIAQGWTPHGRLATVQAGTGVYRLQAMLWNLSGS